MRAMVELASRDDGMTGESMIPKRRELTKGNFRVWTMHMQNELAPKMKFNADETEWRNVLKQQQNSSESDKNETLRKKNTVRLNEQKQRRTKLCLSVCWEAVKEPNLSQKPYKRKEQEGHWSNGGFSSWKQ